MHIRPAREEDTNFILALTPRLLEFGDVPGRERRQMVDRDRAVLARALAQPSENTAIFIADNDEGAAVGFVHVTTSSDYYTDQATAHIADVVVAPDAAGRGIGSALISHAEGWARDRGFAMLTLNVFTANDRARNLYRKLGFQEEWIRCIKPL